MSELPAGWAWARVAELASDIPHALAIGPFGSNLKVIDYQDRGVPLIFVRNIRAHQFGDTRFVSPEKAEELSAHLVRGGDVLVTKMGDPPGDAAVYPAGASEAVITADCIKITPAPFVDARFLAIAIETPAVRQQVLRLTKGVAQKKVSLARFKSVTVPLPPLAEQRRIVAAIEEHLSRLDAAVSQVEVANERLRKLRGRIVDTAVAGSWQQRPFDDVIQLLRNGVFVSRPNAQPPGVPIFRISAVRPMALDIDDIRYAPASESFADEWFVKEGDLLFTRYSGNPAYVGACAAVPPLDRKTLHPDKLIRVTIDRELCLPEYVEIAFASTLVRREVEGRLKTTAGQVGIAGGQLRTVPVPLPPLEVQERIVASVRRGLSGADGLSSALQRASLRAGSLRRSILAQAFRGELVRQDPDDEPASVLLERIATERAAAPVPRRKRRTRTAA